MRKNGKVLFLIESMKADAGGPSFEIMRLTNALIEEGIDITVATLTPKEENLTIDDRIEFFQFRRPSFPRISWLRAIRDLRLLIENHDVVFSTGIWGPIDGFALRLAWPTDKPVYIRICGMLEPYILARSRFKKRLASNLYVRANLSNARGVIVNSFNESYNARRFGIPEERVLIIRNGIESRGFTRDKRPGKSKLGIDTDNRVLLYLGRLHPKKGLHLLLHSLSALPKEQRKLTLLVAGEFRDDTTSLLKVI